MKVESVKPESAGKVETVVVDGRAPGLVATAQVQLHGGRLVVAQLWIAQDPFASLGEPTEVSREALRVFDPPEIVRALAAWIVDPLGDEGESLARPNLTEVRAWFASKGSQSAVAMVDDIEEATAILGAGEAPRRAGRPPKFTDAELRRWAVEALRIDAEQPVSLHRALADAMSASGDKKLAHSTPANARDLIKNLRAKGWLLPARAGGAREPLAAGPELSTKEER